VPVVVPVPVVVTPSAPAVAAPTVTALAAVATELEVVVSPDAPVVMIDPSDNIISPGTVPEPSVNFPDSPALTMTASAVTPVLTELTMTKLYRKFVLPEFTFQFGKYSLAEDGKAVLAGIAKELAKDEKWFIVRLDGHTDSTGPAQYNDKLSLQRAIDYAMYLINEENVDSRRIFVKGFGESAPISSNATPEGRRLNRRVELLLLVRAQKGL
jgi:outer membrane protein OmpA-like peptidoglycan-associated protein